MRDQIDVIEPERDKLVRQGKSVADAVSGNDDSDECTSATIALLTELESTAYLVHDISGAPHIAVLP